MVTPIFLFAIAGLLTGAAMGAVRRSGGTRRGWLLAVGLAVAAGWLLWLALDRLRGV